MGRGACNGLTDSEIEAQVPDVIADPVLKRFPGGESLGDVLQRLSSTLVEVEQEMRPVIVTASVTVLQVLYCYYAQRPVQQAMSIKLPMHTVVEMRPDGGLFLERRLCMQDLSRSMVTV